MEMTIEEAKKMLEAKLKCFIAETSGTNHDCNMRLCDGCALNYEQGNMGEQKEVLDMAIKALESQRWIPCNERLPEIHQDVLLSLRSLDVVVGFRAETEPYFYCQGNYIEPQNVLAWMPLPQPYKEGEE